MTTMREILGEYAEQFEQGHRDSLRKILTDRNYQGDIESMVNKQIIEVFDTEVTQTELNEMDKNSKILYNKALMETK